MKTKTPKARVMWANYYPEIVCCSTSRKSCRVRADTRFTNQVVRVAVIPLDDIESLVERVALALINSARGKDGMAKVGQFYKFPKDSQDFYLNDARAALTAAGIPCAKPTKQRRAKQ